MSKFYFYKCFGLGIKSQIKFPELFLCSTNDDVVISFISEENFPDIPNKNSKIFKISEDDICILLKNKPLIRINNGKNIFINIDFIIDKILLRSIILGQAMGILLHQKGYLVIHGSAVEMEGTSIAFLGDCGAGKSTTAVTLNLLGYPLITDDVIALKFDKNSLPYLIPSFPRIKLWDDVIDHLKINENQFQLIHPAFEKYYYDTNKNFCDKILPLKTVYIIEKSDENRIEPLNSQKSLIELVKNVYMLFLFDKREKEKNLNDCAKVVNQVIFKRLKRSQKLNSIVKLPNIIKKDQSIDK